MFKLVISDDEGKTTVVPLVRDEITIGRKEGNTIRLTERNVSRRHAKLKKANGAFLVEDLASYNGVKVNGRRIDRESHLKAGDQISIGDYLLALQVDAQSDTAIGPAMPAPVEGMPGSDTIPLSVPVPDVPTAMISAPAEPAPPARLVMLTPPAPGAEFAISRPRIRLGRAEDLDVWINHRSISREHAEIVADNGQFRISDLGSANGLRVNGADTRQAVLSPGDVVELGQVRFRFVGPGESYFFEADRTVQMEAIASPSASRVPLMVGGLIVLAGVVAGVAIAFSGGEPETDGIAQTIESTSPAPLATTGNAAPPAPAPQLPIAPAAASSVASFVRACQESLRAYQHDQAIAQADAALNVDRTSQAAAQCRGAAEQLRLEAQAFERGSQHFQASRIDDAYAAFVGIPATSPYHQREEVRQAREMYARNHLNRAQELLGSDPASAEREARLVADMPGFPPDQVRVAEALVARARRTNTRVAIGPSQRAGGQDRGQRPAPTKVPPQQRDPEPAGGGGATQEPAQSNWEEARAASMRGDNMGIIRALEGRARSSRELAMLIEAYRTSSNPRAMCRNLQVFVERFPSARETGNYRQVISRQCNR